MTLPEPRMPELPALPDPATLDGILAGSGGPVSEALAAVDDTLAALNALRQARPGGSAWIKARDVDRAAVHAGKPPKAVAALLAAEPQRYGLALALASTVSERGRVQPAEGLEAAATAAAEDLAGRTCQVVKAASDALTEGRRADAERAREQLAVLFDALSELQAVARWASGEPYEVKPAALPPVYVETYRDVVDSLDRVAPEDGWRAREAERNAAATFRARILRDSA